MKGLSKYQQHFPVNTLTNAVLLGIEDSCDKILKDRSVRAVVVCGAGSRAFCAGADIPDLNKKHARNPKRPFMEYFEELNLPVVAAVQGFALGGGMELSLGCHYRVIADSGFLGLPEVNIGLLPGGQGTQRLPRLIGAKNALQLMLSGDHVTACQALEWKIVDKVCTHAALIETSKAFALEMAISNPGNKGRRISEQQPPSAAKSLFDDMKSQMAKSRRGQPAPQKIIQCVEAACSMNFKDGCKREQVLFSELIGSKEANALQHMFFSERASAKIAGLKAKPAKVNKVGVIGAGLMGGGIAMCFANIGIYVVIVDRQVDFLEKGMAVVRSNYERSVKRGSRSQASIDTSLALFSTSVDYDALKDCDLVIEAVFEDMVLKKEIFGKLDKICKPGCILASNTSFLSIDEIASATSRPQDVIGMHFFSPANVMKLLENVRGSRSSDTTIATAMSIGNKIGKWSVLVGNCYGFVANRMFSYYSMQATQLLMEGCLPAEVDKIASDFGMPMGPLSMSDLTGLAIGFEAKKRKGLVNTDMDIRDWLVETGRLGMKSNAGFYDYSKDRKRSVNDRVNNKILEISKNKGIERRHIETQEIFERIFYPLINEGFKILEEGFADRPQDVDVVCCHGYNWPRITGGPMHYADNIGLSKVLTALQKYQSIYPDESCFVPSKLLQDCVASGKNLADYWNSSKSKNSKL